MFGIKTKIINNLRKNFQVVDVNKSISKIETIALMHLIKQELKRESNLFDIQQPISKKTNTFASKIIKKTSDFMPNNLGNWSIKKPYTLTTKLELSLINCVKNKLGAQNNIIGHFSSGTTEGNIYAAWIARNYLKQGLGLKDFKKIVLIKSSLAHYSIDKAADLTGIKCIETSIHRAEFNIDLKHLEINLTKLFNQGFRGFIIPITLGYTVTGTEDDYLGIIKLINKFEKLHPTSKFFLWIDAAFSGMIKAYLDHSFKPFANNKVFLFSTDLHKSLAVPYPASILLYQKKLLNYIKKPIPYIDQFDTTLLGSRPGINVLASWFTILNLDNKKMKKIVRKTIDKKNQFLKKIDAEKINIRIINNKNSLQTCLISMDKKADQILKKKYNLKGIDYKLMFDRKTKIVKLYKLYFFLNETSN